MTSTPKSSNEDILGESWVNVDTQRSFVELGFPTGDECLRLLREAQRESNQHSLASSQRDSPKSPPNSPAEPDENEEEIDISSLTELDWCETQWSSRPDHLPPKMGWSFAHPPRPHSRRRGPLCLSIRQARLGGSKLFAREVLYTLVVSNVLSVILGAGLGIWLSRRAAFFAH